MLCVFLFLFSTEGFPSIEHLWLGVVGLPIDILLSARWTDNRFILYFSSPQPMRVAK